MLINGCELIQFGKVCDERGNLAFIEGENHIPFVIRRVYYIYGVSTGTKRAGHAHKTGNRVLVALAGSFDVCLRDGLNECSMSLNCPYEGLLINSMTWYEIDKFSAGAICLVLTSNRYNEADYYRDYDDFVSAL